MKSFCSSCNKRVKTINLSSNTVESVFHIVMLCMSMGLWLVVILIDKFFDRIEGRVVCSICNKRI